MEKSVQLIACVRHDLIAFADRGTGGAVDESLTDASLNQTINAGAGETVFNRTHTEKSAESNERTEST